MGDGRMGEWERGVGRRCLRHHGANSTIVAGLAAFTTVSVGNATYPDRRRQPPRRSGILHSSFRGEVGSLRTLGSARVPSEVTRAGAFLRSGFFGVPFRCATLYAPRKRGWADGGPVFAGGSGLTAGLCIVGALHGRLASLRSGHAPARWAGNTEASTGNRGDGESALAGSIVHPGERPASARSGGRPCLACREKPGKEGTCPLGRPRQGLRGFLDPLAPLRLPPLPRSGSRSGLSGSVVNRLAPLFRRTSLAPGDAPVPAEPSLRPDPGVFGMLCRPLQAGHRAETLAFYSVTPQRGRDANRRAREVCDEQCPVGCQTRTGARPPPVWVWCLPRCQVGAATSARGNPLPDGEYRCGSPLRQKEWGVFCPVWQPGQGCSDGVIQRR